MQGQLAMYIKQIWANARVVWIEAARDKSLFILATVGVLLEFFSVVLGNMAVGGGGRIVQDMGFWVISLWGPIAIMFLGSNLVNKELKEKTAYLVLSRPVARSVYLLGKYAGIILGLFTLFVILTAVWGIILWSFRITFTTEHIIAILFLFGEWVLLGAISLFFNVFTSPILHNFFIVGVYFLGHLSNQLYNYAQMSKSVLLEKVLLGIYYILPNLEIFNFKKAALYSQSIETATIVYAIYILLGWIITFNIASFLIFRYAKLR